MYVRIPRVRGLVSADPGGAGIVAIAPDGSLMIELGFTLAQEAEQHARTIRLLACTQILPKDSILEHTVAASVDYDRLMDAIQGAMPRAKARAKAQADLIVASHTERIDRTIAAARVPGHEVAFLAPDVIAAQGLRAGQPIVERTVATRRTASTRELLTDAIIMHGIDPATVVGTQQTNASVGRSVAGTSIQQTLLVSPLVQHLADLTMSPQRDPTSPVAALVPRDTTARADGMIRITVPAARLDRPDSAPIDHLVLILQLLDEGGIDVDSVTLGFDIAVHVAAFKTPRMPPTISVISGKSTATLAIRSQDPATERVLIVSRMIPSSGPVEPGYSIVQEVPVTSTAHDTKVSVPLPHGSTAIYRAIPIGAGSRFGASFGSAVLRSPRPVIPAHVSLVTVTTQAGLSIEVRGIPTRVRSIEVIRRDMTLHESSYTPVGLPIRIDDPERSVDHVSIVDRGLKPDHVYEHACRLTHFDGRTATVGMVHTAYVPFTDGKVVTDIADLQVDRSTGTPDVTFKINTKVQDAHMDTVRRALLGQGVADNYTAEIIAERDKLQKLLVHAVTRVDLISGLREDMGVVVGSEFRDSDHRVVGAAPLVEGRRYRYEVCAAMRAPETLFQTLIKSVVDVSTKKTYNITPARHMHPYTLARGTITSPATLTTRHSQTEFGYGNVGNIALLDVVLDRPIARLLDVTAFPFDSKTVRIGWRLRGDPATVDHFLITQTMSGTRTVLGNSHSAFPHGACEFFHTVPPGEHGPRTYTVTVVSYDLTMGDAQETDQVIL